MNNRIEQWIIFSIECWFKWNLDPQNEDQIQSQSIISELIITQMKNEQN
jgi:hypothetical protein